MESDSLKATTKMAPRYLFLDIDGVLNSARWASSRPQITLLPPQSAEQAAEQQRLDPECVGRLQSLIERTQAEIVITSTWRLRLDVPEFTKTFALHGFPGAPICGITPELASVKEAGRVVTRGAEVAAWLRSRAARLVNFVCLDDGGDFYPSQPLVLTDPEVGLTDANVAACLAVLGSAPGPGS